jgi:hypothetical protein
MDSKRIDRIIGSDGPLARFAFPQPHVACGPIDAALLRFERLPWPREPANRADR